jgi:hypothetical protein
VDGNVLEVAFSIRPSEQTHVLHVGHHGFPSVDPLPFKTESTKCAQDQPVTIEFHCPRLYKTTQSGQDAELYVVDDLAIPHLKRAAVGYEAPCASGLKSR